MTNLGKRLVCLVRGHRPWFSRTLSWSPKYGDERMQTICDHCGKEF